MANKFQKSVMERLEQEARQQKRKAPPSETIESVYLPEPLEDAPTKNPAGTIMEPELNRLIAIQGNQDAGEQQKMHQESQTEGAETLEKAVEEWATGHTDIIDGNPPIPEKRSSNSVSLPKKMEARSAALPDLSEYLRLEPQRQAKNKTFYLDVDVIEAVKSAAKAQRITDSKLVCDILRHILLGEG